MIEFSSSVNALNLRFSAFIVVVVVAVVVSDIDVVNVVWL